MNINFQSVKNFPDCCDETKQNLQDWIICGFKFCPYCGRELRPVKKLCPCCSAVMYPVLICNTSDCPNNLNE